jgi:hypothetical protein
MRIDNKDLEPHGISGADSGVVPRTVFSPEASTQKESQKTSIRKGECYL